MIVQNDGPERLIRAAKTLFEEGKLLLASARQEDDADKFYGKLFLAAPALVGAEYGYGYWGNHPGPRSANKDESLKLSLDVRDSLELVLTALMIAFENSYTREGAFRLHKSYVNQVAKERGSQAANDVIADYTKIKLLYPKSYQHRFLSELG